MYNARQCNFLQTSSQKRDARSVNSRNNPMTKWMSLAWTSFKVVAGPLLLATKWSSVVFSWKNQPPIRAVRLNSNREIIIIGYLRHSQALMIWAANYRPTWPRKPHPNPRFKINCNRLSFWLTKVSGIYCWPRVPSIASTIRWRPRLIHWRKKSGVSAHSLQSKLPKFNKSTKSMMASKRPRKNPTQKMNHSNGTFCKT